MVQTLCQPVELKGVGDVFNRHIGYNAANCSRADASYARDVMSKQMACSAGVLATAPVYVRAMQGPDAYETTMKA